MSLLFTSPLFYGFYISLMIGFFTFFLTKNLLPYYWARKDADKLGGFLTNLNKELSINQKANLLETWLQEHQNSHFIKSFVITSFNAFHQKIIENQKKGIMLVPDVYDYFLEDQLMQKIGKRKLIETVPGLFLAMGIIGTFLGIAVGVSHLNPNGSSEDMKVGIGVLLSGMQVKFLSSIMGIFLSLIWQFLDKMFFYPKLSESFHIVRQHFDEIFPTQEQNTVLFQMLSNQEKQMLDFQSFITEMMIPQIVSGMTEAIHQSIAPQMEQTQAIMHEMISTSKETQLTGIELMVDKFVSSMNEISGDHMEQLGEALSTTIEWQKKVQEGMGLLVERMELAALEQTKMAEKTTFLTESVHTYSDKFLGYETIMENNISLLNSTLDKNNELYINISSLLQAVNEERTEFTNNIQSFNTTIYTLKEQTIKQIELNEKLESNLQGVDTFYESQTKLFDSFSDSLNLSNQSNKELSNLVESLNEYGDMQLLLQQEITTSMQIILQEKTEVGSVVTNLNHQLMAQLADIDKRIDYLSNVWQSTSSLFTEANKQLSTSMNQFADDMHRGLEHTFKQFDEELANAVKHLSKAVEAIQVGIVDLPDSIQVLNKSVTELNKMASVMLEVDRGPINV